MNCIKILADKNFHLMKNENFRNEKEKINVFLSHWNEIAKKLSIKKNIEK